jgi:hypothetical protein
MADAPVVQMGESREQVAFKLLELVAGSEKVLLRGSPASGWESAISAIGDGQQRDEAQVYWEFSTVINWSHPMTRGLMALAGITPEDAAAMWMVAKDYEA